MPPGGEMFRFSPRFGENELRHGSHEWLPYSKDEVRLKSSNTNLPRGRGNVPGFQSVSAGFVFSPSFLRNH